MKVGEYIRTVGGLIGKVIEIEGNAKTYEIPNRQENDVIEIIKSSPSIIDLIEVGDYVNGSKIIELATNIDGKVLYLETDITEFDNVYACGHINIYENDIRSIVTHEQFSQMEYRIGE